MRCRWRLATVITLDLASLVALRPRWGALQASMGAPHAWVHDVGADAAAATLCAALLWCVAAWLALGLLALAAAALPGAAGRLGGAVTCRLLPRAVLRLAAGATGLSVLLAPAWAGAQPAGPAQPAPATSAATLPAPALPGQAPLPAPSLPRSSSDAGPPGTPGTPGTPQTPGTPARSTGSTTPRRPAPQPGPRPGYSAPLPRHRAPAQGGPAGRAVIVAPGDSLWTIASDRLGRGATPARIAEAWPRWYAANRAVIGPDPALIRPGAVLNAPAHEEDTA